MFWEVEEFASGERALGFLRQRRDIAFLLMDIRLTGALTGRDVAEAYRVVNPEMKVFCRSGNAREPATQVVGSEFMPKPCHMDTILNAAPAVRLGQFEHFKPCRDATVFEQVVRV